MKTNATSKSVPFVLLVKLEKPVDLCAPGTLCLRARRERPPARRCPSSLTSRMITSGLIFFIIPMIVQCVNIENATCQSSGTVLKDADDFEQRAVQVKLKSSSCQFFPRLLDSLKQWKKRRKCCGFMNALRKTDKLILKRSASATVEIEISELSENSSLVKSFKQRWPVGNWRKWLFTDDYLLLINRHWLQFSPPDPLSQYALGALYVVMAIVGCTGNAIVLLMYFK